MSDTVAPSMRVLNSYDQVTEAKAEMKAAFDAAITASREGLVYAAPSSPEARHFIEVLGRLLDTEDAAGYETIPQCLGTEWLFAHTYSFAMLVEGSPAGFLKQHLNRYAGNFLLCSRLLSTIDEAELLDFVRDVLTVATPFNNDWVQVLLDFNIPQSAIVELVLDKLRHTYVDSRYNSMNFVRDEFLRYGADYELDSYSGPYLRERRATLWSILSDEELAAALRICDRKIPGIVFKERYVLEALQARFTSWQVPEDKRAAGEQFIQGILAYHADRLQGLAVRYDVFGRLPIEKQVELVHKFEGGNTELLVRVAMAANDRELFDEYVANLAMTKDYGHYGSTYVALQSVLRVNGYTLLVDYADHIDERIRLADHIDETLRTNLKSCGFVLDFVRDEIIRGRGCYVVHANGWRYIHDSYTSSRGYYPRAGDLVVFSGEKGRPGRNMRNRDKFVHFQRVNRPAASS